MDDAARKWTEWDVGLALIGGTASMFLWSPYPVLAVLGATTLFDTILRACGRNMVSIKWLYSKIAVLVLWICYCIMIGDFAGLFRSGCAAGALFILALLPAGILLGVVVLYGLAKRLWRKG